MALIVRKPTFMNGGQVSAGNSQTAIAIVLDQYFANNTLLLTGDGVDAAQNNTFLDSSPNNFTITRNGNTTQGSYSPYGDRWSNYFDGTGDYLSVSTGGAFGTNSWTIEAWVYRTATGTTRAIFDHNTSSSSSTGFAFVVNSSEQLGAYWSGSYQATVNNFPSNQWVHVAATYDGTNLRLFVNGELGATSAESINFTTDAYFIGSSDANQDWLGYISDVRIVNGTALYTAAFTPPTEPLTAVSGTSLLTCQSNRFKDNSSNDSAITVSGNPQVTPFSPYGNPEAYDSTTVGGSGYFDGTGDYLTTSSSVISSMGTSAWTLEFWFYATDTLTRYTIFSASPDTNNTSTVNVDIGNNQLEMQLYTNGSNDLLYGYTGSTTSPINYYEWTHVALCHRGGGEYQFYLNGVAQTATAVSGYYFNDIGTADAEIGHWAYNNERPLHGYLSDLRVVSGTDLYTSNFTPPTAPLTAVSGTELLCNFTNAGIFDSTGKNVLETVNGAQVDTAVTKYGTGSIYFDGSSDILTIKDAPEFDLGSDDFTFEFWTYVNNVSGYKNFINKRNSASGYRYIWFSLDGAGIRLWATSNGSTWDIASQFYFGVNLNALQWYHIALVRNGNTITLYVDGVAAPNTVTTTASIFNSTDDFHIGGDITNYYLNGYIDDFRFTKGIARYTANFTPPTAALPTSYSGFA